MSPMSRAHELRRADPDLTMSAALRQAWAEAKAELSNESVKKPKPVESTGLVFAKSGEKDRRKIAPIDNQGFSENPEEPRPSKFLSRSSSEKPEKPTRRRFLGLFAAPVVASVAAVLPTPAIAQPDAAAILKRIRAYIETRLNHQWLELEPIRAMIDGDAQRDPPPLPPCPKGKPFTPEQVAQHWENPRWVGAG